MYSFTYQLFLSKNFQYDYMRTAYADTYSDSLDCSWYKYINYSNCIIHDTNTTTMVSKFYFCGLIINAIKYKYMCWYLNLLLYSLQLLICIISTILYLFTYQLNIWELHTQIHIWIRWYIFEFTDTLLYKFGYMRCYLYFYLPHNYWYVKHYRIPGII